MTTDLQKLESLLEKVCGDRHGKLEWFADMDKFELCLDWPRETIGKFACGPRAAYAALPLAAEVLNSLPALLSEITSLRKKVEEDQAVIRACAERFREYEASHLAKANKAVEAEPERAIEMMQSLGKATRNGVMKRLCEARLLPTPVSSEGEV